MPRPSDPNVNAIQAGSRPRVQQGPGSCNPALLKEIKAELLERAKEAASLVREISDDIESIVAGCDNRSRDEWKRLLKEFKSVKAQIRDVAGTSSLHVRDVLGPVKNHLGSKDGAEAKRTEIHLASEGLRELIEKTEDVERQLNDICERIKKLASRCIQAKNIPPETQHQIKNLQRKALRMMKLETRINRKTMAIIDHWTTGIVKSIARLTKPSTLDKVIAFIGVKNASTLVARSDTDVNIWEINMVIALVDAGRMLEGDFDDIGSKMRQQNAGDPVTKVNFLFVIELYSQFAEVVDIFHSECIKGSSARKEGFGAKVMKGFKSLFGIRSV